MKIVVLAGGLSTERDVSISSGIGVCRALQERGHQAVLVDLFLGMEESFDLDTVFAEKGSVLPENTAVQTEHPDLEKVKAMRKGDDVGLFGPRVIEICKRADIVYMGLHGADGENGKVQAAFDVLGIRYTGSGYLGSALAMHKGLAKTVFRAEGIPSPQGFCVTRETAKASESQVSYPCVVKPCCGGSSVGVSMANTLSEYREALAAGFCFEGELLVEEYIKGREFSVGVLDGKSLPIIEIIPKEGFYDYKTKYQSGMAQDICPAPIPEDLTEKMQGYAERVYQALRLDAYGRIDFLLDDKNQMYCLEANTLPGMTPLSLLPQEAKETGMDYGELCETVIRISLEKYKEKGNEE